MSAAFNHASDPSNGQRKPWYLYFCLEDLQNYWNRAEGAVAHLDANGSWLV